METETIAMSLFSFGFSSSKRGATESRSETESQSTDADCPAGQPSAMQRREARCKKKEDKSAGLEKSAAIRPFATKKSRLASEKIHLVHSLATESCRLADRLSTKPFFESGQRRCGPNVIVRCVQVAVLRWSKIYQHINVPVARSHG